jgi:hypothetical protein
MLVWCAASASAALPAAAVAVVPDANAIPVWVWSDYKDNADYKTGMPGYMLLCMEVRCMCHARCLIASWVAEAPTLAPACPRRTCIVMIASDPRPVPFV